MKQVPGDQPQSPRPDTLPKRFLTVARETPDRVALRYKDFGVWQEISWGAYWAHVERTALGLERLGLRRGDRIAVLSENRPEWLYADLAAQCLGAITVGVFADSTPAEIEYVLKHSEAGIVVVEDQEQTDKVLSIRGHLPRLEHVVFIDGRGMRHYHDPILRSFQELEELGGEHLPERGGYVEQQVAGGREDDPALICYTSGTTGRPKAALLSHRNMLWLADTMSGIDGMNEDDQTISYLPLPWTGERMFSLYFPLAARYQVNIPETMDMDVVLENMAEIFPSILLCVPRVWENLVSVIRIKVENAGRLKRLAFNTFMPVGYRVADLRMQGRSIPLWLRLLHGIGEWLCYRPVKERLGLSYLRIAYTGGAALGPDVMRFFHALGIEIRQAFGQTEIAGMAVTHRPGEVRLDTVGRPLPGVELRIADDGEILFRGPSVFLGYLNDPGATAQALRDGWLYTGDQGYLDDDGQLVVIDRKRDIIRTAAGHEFSPQLLENRLKFSPYIHEAVVVGQGLPYVAALIEIDLETVGNWGQKRGIPYTTFKDLSRRPEVRELVASEVGRINGSLPEGSRVQAFALLEKQLDPDDDEVTRTRKLRRDVILSKYADLVEQLYVAGPDVALALKEA